MQTHAATRIAICLTFCALLATAAGCQSTYYGIWEKLGWHKRDILVERVSEARDEQQDAKEQFKSALEQFADVVQFEGGDLQAKYDKLAAQLDVSKASADRVSQRIDSVESVAEALFAEWEDELEQYQNQDLRRLSEQQLRETRKRYDALIGAMRAAEAKMAPVLTAFNDHVLFLKHNLNARAIASLQGTTAELEQDVARLIHEMEQAIDEANTFIDSMGSTN